MTRFAEAVVGALRMPMVIIDQQLQILAASPPFRDLLGTRDDPQGQDLLSLDGGRWDVPGLRQALANVLPQEQSFDDVEVPGPGGAPHYVSARALHTEDSKPELTVIEFGLVHGVARTSANRMTAPVTRNGALIFQSGCHGSFVGRETLSVSTIDALRDWFSAPDRDDRDLGRLRIC